jgi:CRISPR/Cas system CSM-associated protein Csm2 small subunit
MKILLSNNTSFEITNDILTIEELLTIAERLKELAITSRSLGQQFIPIQEQQPQEEVEVVQEQEQQEDLSELPLDERVYKLRQEGNSNSQIAKAYNLTISQVRKLYQRAYQRHWMNKNREKYNKTKTTKGKVRQRKPMQSRWEGRDEALAVIKTHYFGTKQEKEEWSRKKGKPWNTIVKALYNLTKRYKIKPSDLGLQRWGKDRSEAHKKPIQKPVSPSPQPQIQSQLAQESISIAEKQFIEFFTNYMQKGGAENELKQAILLLKQWLVSQGKTGNVLEIQNFLGTRIKSLKPIVAPATLEEWLK